MSVQSQTCHCSHSQVSAVTLKYNSNYVEYIVIVPLYLHTAFYYDVLTFDI